MRATRHLCRGRTALLPTRLRIPRHGPGHGPGFRIGPYYVVDLIAMGGQSVVYAARHASTGEEVALKVLPIAWSGVPGLRDRLRWEAGALARVDHPNVVRLVDVGTLGANAGGGMYVAMERLASSLDRELRARGTLPTERAVAVVQGVLAGLAALHAAGLLHRDVKPANVLLRTGGAAVLADLGLSVEAEAARAALTPWNAVVGTAEYLAPERVAGGAADVRSDLYAVGVMLYELLAGRAPFVGPRASAVMRAQRIAPPPRLAAPVPPPLAAVVDRALCKRPDDRYQSAPEMADALAAATPTAT
jgi:serine/threonine protein kinase